MNIKDLYIEHNTNSDTTLVFVQGGFRKDLVTDLSVELSKMQKESYYYLKTVRFFKKYFCKKVNFVQVKQFQHLNPKFVIRNINDATRFNTKNIDILNDVISHIISQDKKVILVGQSYGSFACLKYISKYGVDHLDKIILAHGRLYTPRVITSAIKHWKSWVFFNKHGEVASIEKFNDDKNTKLIFAQMMQDDYVELLKDIPDLSKLHYFASNGDNLVGNISQYEKDFLKSKNAHLTIYSTKLITFIYLLTFKRIDPGRIAHHMIFTPYAWFNVSSLINRDAKKISIDFLKPEKIRSKAWNKFKDIKKQKATKNIKKYQRYKVAKKEKAWQEISFAMKPHLDILSINHTANNISLEEIEIAKVKMKKLNKKRRKLYSFID